MIATVVVLGTAGLAVAFLVAWLVRPDLRAFVERPKHGFHATVQAYDRSRRAEAQSGQGGE